METNKPGLGEARALLRADLIGQLAKLGYATPGHSETDGMGFQRYIPAELPLDGLTRLIKDVVDHFTITYLPQGDIENWLAERVRDAK